MNKSNLDKLIAPFAASGSSRCSGRSSHRIANTNELAGVRSDQSTATTNHTNNRFLPFSYLRWVRGSTTIDIQYSSEEFARKLRPLFTGCARALAQVIFCVLRLMCVAFMQTRNDCVQMTINLWPLLISPDTILTPRAIQLTVCIDLRAREWDLNKLTVYKVISSD